MDSLDHLIKDFMMYLLPCMACYGVRVPENKRVYPLLAMPALVLVLGQKLPLVTAWHLLFHSDYTAEDHFSIVKALW